MPQVGASNEPLHERLGFGYDGADYRVIKVDTDGNLVLAVKAGQVITVEQADPADLKATVNVAAGQSIEVTQDTAADLKATVSLAADQNVQSRRYGYFDSSWVKCAPNFGVTLPIARLWSNLDLAAGNVSVDSSAVPAGEVWVVTVAAFVYTGTPPTQVNLRLQLQGADVNVWQTLAAVSGRLYNNNSWFVLAAGDYLRYRIIGATLHDTFSAYLAGFKMAVS